MDSFDYAEALQQGVLFGFTLITSVFLFCAVLVSFVYSGDRVCSCRLLT